MAIFEGKIAQLCALIKSTTVIVGISNFGIGHFKRYSFKLCRKKFRFIGTLNKKNIGCIQRTLASIHHSEKNRCDIFVDLCYFVAISFLVLIPFIKCWLWSNVKTKLYYIESP